MTPRDVSRLAGVHVSLVYRDIQRGDIDAVQLDRDGRRWDIPPEEGASWARWIQRYAINEELTQK